MAELEGINKQNRRGGYEIHLIFESDAVFRLSRSYASVDIDPTPAQLMPSFSNNFYSAGMPTEYFTQEVFANAINKIIIQKPRASYDGILALEYPVPLRPMQRIFCYLATDRLALVARLKTVDKVPLANMISIFVGNYYKEILMSNEKGIAYGYLQPDNYYNTIVISPNGIVYQEIERSQDAVGTYDITLGRVTKANVPFRLPHRKFV